MCESVVTNASHERDLSHCNTVQPSVNQCDPVLHTATHCNILQHIATHCNMCMILSRHKTVTQAPAFPVASCVQAIHRKGITSTDHFFPAQRTTLIVDIDIVSGSVLSNTAIFPKKEGRKRESSNESARGGSPWRNQHLGEHRRRTEGLARHSKDTANDHLVQTSQ